MNRLKQMVSLGYMGRIVVGVQEGIKLLDDYMRSEIRR